MTEKTRELYKLAVNGYLPRWVGIIALSCVLAVMGILYASIRELEGKVRDGELKQVRLEVDMGYIKKRLDEIVELLKKRN